LVYLLVWSPPPHIPYISSPNQCLLFAAHAHTIVACFAVVSILYHQIPSISLNSLLGTLSFTLTLHIHLRNMLLKSMPITMTIAIAFSALTLLVGHQEEHPSYKKIE